MDQKFPKPMTPFDSLVTPHHLYLMKLLLPYVPPAFQRMLACYIKFMEFQYTLEHFQGFSSSAGETSHSKRPKALHGPRWTGNDGTNGKHDEYDGNGTGNAGNGIFYAGFRF